MLVERAGWLPTADRALVEAVYGEGLTVIAFVRRCLDRGIAPVDRTALSITEGGDASGSLEAWTRVARRRLRRLVARLESDRFMLVVGRRNAWATTRRRVAVTCVLQGRSLRQASRDLGLSLHTVRRHMEAVEAACEAYAEAGREARSVVRSAVGSATGSAVGSGMKSAAHDPSRPSCPRRGSL